MTRFKRRKTGARKIGAVMLFRYSAKCYSVIPQNVIPLFRYSVVPCFTTAHTYRSRHRYLTHAPLSTPLWVESRALTSAIICQLKRVAGEVDSRCPSHLVVWTLERIIIRKLDHCLIVAININFWRGNPKIPHWLKTISLVRTNIDILEGPIKWKVWLKVLGMFSYFHKESPLGHSLSTLMDFI